jgi:hypothetical protein
MIGFYQDVASRPIRVILYEHRVLVLPEQEQDNQIAGSSRCHSQTRSQDEAVSEREAGNRW